MAMTGRGNSINVEKWSEMLEMPYYRRKWRRFNFLGKKHYNISKKGKNIIIGEVHNISDNSRVNTKILNSILIRLEDPKRRHLAASFYGGIIAFCLPYIKDKITYYHDDRPKANINTKKCCDNLRFPTWAEEKFERIWTSGYSFETFLRHLDDLPISHFDLQSALNAYRLQGKRSIFNILTQCCTFYDEQSPIKVALCPELPVTKRFKVSEYVSGVVFPACVMPYFNKTKCVVDNDGIFIVNEDNKAVDCAKINLFDCHATPLENRVKFLSRYKNGGAPYVICHTWLEIVEAVGMFQGDVVVRSMCEDMLNTSYNRFGPGGLMVGWLRDDKISRLRRIDRARVDLPKGSYMGDEFFLGAVSLDGKKIVKNIGKEEIIWSRSEYRDWIELGELCKEKIKQWKRN